MEVCCIYNVIFLWLCFDQANLIKPLKVFYLDPPTSIFNLADPSRFLPLHTILQAWAVVPCGRCSWIWAFMNTRGLSFFPSHRAPKLVLPHFLHCQVVLAGTFMRCSDRAGLGPVESSSGISFASREGRFLDALCRASWSQSPLLWKPCVFPAHHIADIQVCNIGFLPPTWFADVFRVSGEICFPSQPKFPPLPNPSSIRGHFLNDRNTQKETKTWTLSLGYDYRGFPTTLSWCLVVLYGLCQSSKTKNCWNHSPSPNDSGLCLRLQNAHIRSIRLLNPQSIPTLRMPYQLC